jgi:hypothetical protein
MKLHSWREYGVVRLTFIGETTILLLFNNRFGTFSYVKLVGDVIHDTVDPTRELRRQLSQRG